MSNECCNTDNQVVLTPEIKKIITESPFLALATISKAGQPHLIIVGKVKEIRDDNSLIFGVYKMNKTKENIAETGTMQVAAASGKSGYRLTGKACIKESDVIFNAEKIESLL